MPTYEYECSKCGTVFDLFQPITEPPRKKLRSTDPKPCKCNAAVSRRISTGGGLIFKGSGFYITDYRSESHKAAAKSDASAGPAASPSPPARAAPSTPKKESGAGGSPAKSAGSSSKSTSPKAA